MAATMTVGRKTPAGSMNRPRGGDVMITSSSFVAAKLIATSNNVLASINSSRSDSADEPG